MSASNGEVIHIGDEGMVKFQFGTGERALVIAVDVLKANDEWAELDWSFRGPDGKVVPEKMGAQREASIGFVRDLIVESVRGQPEKVVEDAKYAAATLNYAQAGRFHSQVVMQVRKLKPFFSVDTGSEPSPPPPSAQVTFSE